MKNKLNQRHARPAVIAFAFLTAATANLAQAGDLKRGEKLFEECRACHAVERGVQGVGPSLRGVFGRSAGAVEEFRYSPALRKSGITWTAQTIDAYITDPQKAIPANRMPYAGMPDAKDRKDLMEYLQKALK